MSHSVSQSISKVGPALHQRSVDEFSEDSGSAEAAPFEGAVAIKLEDRCPCAFFTLMCNGVVGVSILRQQSTALEGLMCERTK
jgi:hypothetical protein